MLIQSVVSRVQSAARNMETVTVGPLRELISKINDREEGAQRQEGERLEVLGVSEGESVVNEVQWDPVPKLLIQVCE